MHKFVELEKFLFKKILIFFLAIIFCHESLAFFPINLFKNYDVNFRVSRCGCEKVQFAVLYEHLISAKGRDFNGNITNILQIWNIDQDALTMIRGFEPNSDIGKIAAALNDVNDDGIRGHFLPTAKIESDSAIIFAKYYLPHNFSFDLHLPVYSMKLKDVYWQELTQDVNDFDLRVKKELTNDFFINVKELGGLNLNGWGKTAIGDMQALVHWNNDFPQNKPVLKNVNIDLRLGLSLPTGPRRNEDKLFLFSFGNDKAWGIIFGGGISLNWGCYINGGVDVEFLRLFGNTRNRRIKTDLDQTELLLLEKTEAFKEFGLLERYNLYLEAANILRGFSLRVAYQFLKHNEDKLWILDSHFFNSIANSAESLQDWTIHQLIFKLGYDFSWCFCKQYNPNLSLYFKLPFEGKRSIQAKTFGFAFSLSF